jgi:general secretion pathway protein H
LPGISGEAGFTLVEMVCALAIVAMVAAIVLPAIPIGTTRTRLEAYAVETAALLRADRNAAIRRRTPVVTELSAVSRSIRSGASGRVVRLPDDVHFDALLAARCAGRAAGTTISFFPSGMSCGGTIALTRPGAGFQIRVNWLTGGVDVVPVEAL